METLAYQKLDRNAHKNVDFADKERFLESNLNLVHYCCKRFKSRAEKLGIDYDDVFSTGCLGLVRAYQLFDPIHGIAFSTYAVPMIEGTINRFIRDNDSSGLRVSRGARELAYKLHKLREETGVELTDIGMICEKFETTAYYASTAVKIIQGEIYSVSLDTPLTDNKGDSNKSIIDLVNTGEVDFSLEVAINEFKECLPEDLRKLLDMYQVHDSQVDIATAAGFSQSHVSRLLKKLKHFWKEFEKGNIGLSNKPKIKKYDRGGRMPAYKELSEPELALIKELHVLKDKGSKFQVRGCREGVSLKGLAEKHGVSYIRANTLKKRVLDGCLTAEEAKTKPEIVEITPVAKPTEPVAKPTEPVANTPQVTHDTEAFSRLEILWHKESINVQKLGGLLWEFAENITRTVKTGEVELKLVVKKVNCKR